MKKILLISSLIFVIFLISGCGNKSYQPGTAVYFNPVTSKKCNNYTKKNSIDKFTDGCMKWYIYDDNGDGTVDMILDHNLGSSIFLNDANEYLEKFTSNWNQEVSSTARLISADEIAKITGHTNFDSSTATSSDGFSLENKDSVNEKESSDYVSKYHWLFDNLCSCKKYGCAEEGDESCSYDYTTDTKVNDDNSNVWFIINDGTLDARRNVFPKIRPVITVSKELV